MRDLPSTSRLRISSGFSQSWLTAAAAGLLLLPVFGCGPSQHDLMMRAARRPRPDAEKADAEKADAEKADAEKADAEQADAEQAKAEKPSPPKPQVAKVEQPVEPQPTTATAAPASAATTSTGAEQATQAAAKPKLTPIEQRQPAEPLTEQQRRARAFDNVERIAKALKDYFDEHNRFPQSYSTLPGNFPALSWRVHILPYLGYDELYAKFDRSLAWNREPNRSLLQYIPDEFVSPERFDTNTNYLLPAYSTFLFGQNKSRGEDKIGDGVHDTLMLVEVNDNLAVPWTQPTDYVPEDWKRIVDDLGDLRGDGAFAAWASGWPTLVSNSLDNAQIFHAMTCDSADGGGAIHQVISLNDPTASSVAAASATSDASTSTMAPMSAASNRNSAARQPAATADSRQPVPAAAAVAEAQTKLRLIYADRIREATDDDRAATKLAREILQVSQTMQDDLPGMYTLQSAAMKIALDSGDIAILIQAIDQRIATFDVDAYQENANGLLAFGRAAAGQDSGGRQNMPLLRRCVRVISAGVDADDFARAAALTQMATRFTQTPSGGRGRDSRQLVRRDPHELIGRLLMRLRSTLVTADSQYELVKGELQRYRSDPSNHESGAVVGRYLCFIKGDWDTGLPLLAAGGPAQLREVAEQDLRGARTTDEMIGRGDAWWALSERAGEGVYRQGAQDRAIHWYQQAYDLLPDSLDKMHVKSRMEDAFELDGGSPLAVCNQLASEVGVTLDVGLKEIASNGGLRRGADQDDDEYH